MVLALERGERQGQREEALGAVCSLLCTDGDVGWEGNPPAQILGHSSSSSFLRALVTQR